MAIGINKNQMQNRNKNQNKGQRDDMVNSRSNREGNLDDSDEIQDLRGYTTNASYKSKVNPIILFVTGGLILLVVGGLILYFITNKSSTAEEAQEPLVQQEEQAGDSQEQGQENTQSSEAVYDSYGRVIDEEGVDPGIPDFEYSEKSHTSTKVVKPDDFIKDLNGVDISAVYNVVERNYIQDYVSYTAKRAIIDEGMELYWLEAKYDGKKYRIQVPFYYFKDLKGKGICKVEMEVLTTEDGGKIISYMQAVSDD